MGSVIDDRVYGALVSAQVADLNLKIDLSIDQTVRLLRTEMKSLIFPTVVGPPTLSKVICETVLRCFGLTKAEANQVDAIMEDIVWPNMVKYMAQHITQNLAVCLLYTGHIQDARTLLADLIDQSPPFHSLVFNLSTVFELCTEKNKERKLGLAEKLAARREGRGVGWELSTADFKL